MAGNITAIDRRGPRIHGIRVRVIEQQRMVVRHVPNIAAKLQNLRDIALAVHDAARANRVADALVNAVFQGNVHIHLKRFQAAYSGEIQHVIRALKPFAPVSRRRDFRGLPVGANVAFRQLRNLVLIALIDVNETKFGLFQFRNAKNVSNEFSGKFDASRAENGNVNAHNVFLRRHAKTQFSSTI